MLELRGFSNRLDSCFLQSASDFFETHARVGNSLALFALALFGAVLAAELDHGEHLE